MWGMVTASGDAKDTHRRETPGQCPGHIQEKSLQIYHEHGEACSE